MKPLMFDFFCGLGGATEGFQAEGWNCIGIDNERHDYGNGGYPAQLVLYDILTFHGSQCKNADFFWFSPPCQFFSYTAMPWSRAKKLAEEVRRDPVRLAKELALFQACFRIQREASEAAGRYIPLIVENVRGAQPWVGRSRWHYGSFHLWGDVPALMPISRAVAKVGIDFNGHGTPGYCGVAFNSTAEQRFREGQKNPGFRFDGSGRSFQSESVARQISPAWQAKHYDETKKMQLGEGRKGAGAGAVWFDQNHCVTSSKSSARKAASAQIAKIPFPLARHLARCFKP